MELTISQGTPQSRWTRYLFIGVLGGCINLSINFSVIALLRLLPPDILGKSAAQDLFAGTQSTGALFFSMVVFAPLFETMLAQWLPIEIARKLGAGKNLCILLSAFLFGLGHYVNGGLGHGLTTFCGGLLLAYLYLRVRNESLAASYWTTCTAHATHNLVMLLIIVFFVN